ncbi:MULTISPECIES: IS256 family transposase [Cetobacterium]|nr:MULTISPECIES: IS256 family transposase [Cetobacterium]
MSEEEKQKRIKVREFLKQNPISSPDDLNTFFKDMMKVMIEEFYQGELEEELGYTKYDYRNKDSNNSRNGYSSKKLKSSAGEIEVNVPRDRNGEYEPQVVKKHQNTIGQDLEAKIISMYAKGMTTSDIESHIEEIYGYQVSDSSITRITDKILPLVKEWQTRPLEAVYPIVFMDAIHYHVRSEGQIVKKAVYIAIGISSSGEKDVIGMWVGENESAKFWLSKLNELKSRGVEDILIACVDGLIGFANAIEAVYPQTQIQQCIIHQIRSSTQFVSYKDIKALIADLKLVYKATTEESALLNLELFDEKWGKKYPKIAISWKNNWSRLSTYFKYPQEIRTLIYTTNTIEGYNRQLRKVTKNKSVFPTDDSLLKMLYLATQDITKKWTSRQRDWGQMISQFQIYFEGRI